LFPFLPIETPITLSQKTRLKKSSNIICVRCLGVEKMCGPRIGTCLFLHPQLLPLARRVTISLKGLSLSLGAHLVGGAEEAQNAKGTMLFKVGCGARALARGFLYMPSQTLITGHDEI